MSENIHTVSFLRIFILVILYYLLDTLFMSIGLYLNRMVFIGLQNYLDLLSLSLNTALLVTLYRILFLCFFIEVMVYFTNIWLLHYHFFFILSIRLILFHLAFFLFAGLVNGFSLFALFSGGELSVYTLTVLSIVLTSLCIPILYRWLGIKS